MLRHLILGENGGALAEFAIIVPLLAVMLAGVSEFGRLFQTYTTLAKATRSSSRYLASHTLLIDDALNTVEINRAISLVVCGKLTCAGGDELVRGFGASNVCLEQTPSDGVPKVTSVTVRIPRSVLDQNGQPVSDCNPIPGTTNATPFVYQPIFDIGALTNNEAFSLAYPISASSTMPYMNN
jgi:Flp pilus assembly pilin Flp